MDERLELLSQVDNLDRFFVFHPPTPGLPHPDKTIYDSPEFIQWKEKAKYQLKKLKPSQTIDETIDLLDSFKGWRDESDLKKLKAKIQIILDNPEDFLPEEDFEETMVVQRLKKGAVLHTAFDDYELIKQIGQGGNGKVFSAKDSKGYDVAIKFVERNETDKNYKRLKNEIHFCEKAQHKNIIKITDRGYAVLDDRPYVFYVMPLYPNTLRAKMKEGLTPEVAIAVFVGIMQGLKFAHERGVYHRDIKPENILIDENGNPIICDFGIAHFAEEDLITAVETKATDRLANYQYAAPEQKIKGGAKLVTGKADVYAVGLILNEMFTGEVPQAGGYKTIAEVKPEYAFLDELFDKLYQQKTDDRLFPADKILNELYALIENIELEKKKAELEKAISTDNDEIDFNLNVVHYSYRDNGIVFELDKPFPMEWFSLLVDLDSYTYVMGYEPKRIHGADNEQSLVMPVKGNENIELLKRIIDTVNEWIKKTNINYRNDLKKKAEKKRREEREAKAKQIEEAKKTQEINAMLAEL